MTHGSLVAGRGLLAGLGIFCSAQVAAAQIPECPVCFLGIYDDKERTRTEGTTTGATKDVYVGVDLSGQLAGFSAVGFSISGLEGLRVEYEVLGNPLVQVGDCVAFHENCGLILGWDTANCQPAHATVLRLTLSTLNGAWPTNRELKIRLALPIGDPPLVEPYVTLCEDPATTNVIPIAGGYMLNRTLAVERATWSTTKALFD
jgi:hypothetical protein